jgi:hypothetical protein
MRDYYIKMTGALARFSYLVLDIFVDNVCGPR